MHIHYVMTARDLIVASKSETTRSNKCALLYKAAECLNKTERLGVSPNILKELRTAIINEYILDYEHTDR